MRHYDFLHDTELHIKEIDVGVSGKAGVSLMLYRRSEEDAPYQLVMSQREARKLSHDLDTLLGSLRAAVSQTSKRTPVARD